MRFLPLLLATLATPVVIAGVVVGVPSAHAAGLSKADRKAFEDEVKAAYPGTVWALKDLPVTSGFTMGAAWIAPIVEVTAGGFKIEAIGGMSASYGSASSLWWSVRPNDSLTMKEVKFDDDWAAIAFVGTGASKGRDTKIKIIGAKTFAEVKAVMDQLVTAISPVQADWSTAVKDAITKRALVNGMTKRQAYLVVGEPTEATTKDEGGKKVEIWKPRQSGGMRIGYGASVEVTGYPSEVRFVDGVIEGLASTGAGVSLD